MKTVAFLILCLCCELLAISQPLGDLQYYLNHPEVLPDAKAYYKGKFTPSDDDRTFAIVESMQTEDSSLRPFYIFINSKILAISDGALAEYMGLACLNFWKKCPNCLVEYLYAKNEHASRYDRENWAQQIAGEHLISKGDKDAIRLVQSDNSSICKTCKPENYGFCIDFAIRIELAYNRYRRQ